MCSFYISERMWLGVGVRGDVQLSHRREKMPGRWVASALHQPSGPCQWIDKSRMPLQKLFTPDRYTLVT